MKFNDGLPFILLGRVFGTLLIQVILTCLGGISTSLVYSVFESWMISAHSAQGFQAILPIYSYIDRIWYRFIIQHFCLVYILEQYRRNCSRVSFFDSSNELSKIYRVFANWLVDHFGLYSPFIAAGVFAIIAFAFISLSWSENYGTSTTKQGSKKPFKTLSFWESILFIANGILFFNPYFWLFCFRFKSLGVGSLSMFFWNGHVHIYFSMGPSDGKGYS